MGARKLLAYTMASREKAQGHCSSHVCHFFKEKLHGLGGFDKQFLDCQA
jgi:hypothetical protein